ncbi:MAG: replication-associated recombination protein A [Bacteroidetes bacterium]|nr:replication-associated recombination protein A [Bacteroidota bacterium]MDA0902873.1 replication-associated recombination protein A [Bacteroidota bacterium]MDA1241974.1 replication-associated recombination protein A [Bacteroidota bacterium]
MSQTPLAERMRPTQLDEVVGQDHLVGEQAILRRAVQTGNLPSMILWGPPGVGKTTLARLLAEASGRPFHALSAIHSGVKDVRQVLDSAKRDGMFAGRAVLFLDEIHRFSKSQQDSLLGAVEAGIVTLIGATTENPSFEVIPALRSRCQVYVLEPLTAEALKALALRALREDQILSKIGAEVVEWEALLRASGGDARRMLNILESIVLTLSQSGDSLVNNAAVEAQIQQHVSSYDKSGEQHYDIISAFIKSIRASDPNAAVYYLARMVEGGEDPTFIARRMLISASEDIGNANPTALVLANSTFSAVQRTGWPEARIILAQCTVYLATSPKSNASYQAIGAAQQWIRTHGEHPVPLSLRNAPTSLMKDLGYGLGYEVDHNSPGSFSGRECMPKGMEGTVFYQPGNNPKEHAVREWLKSLWKGKYKY